MYIFQWYCSNYLPYVDRPFAFSNMGFQWTGQLSGKETAWPHRK